MRKSLAYLLLFIFSTFLSSQTFADSLPSGGSVSGYLFPEDIDSFTFSGNSGETVTLIMSESHTSVGRIYIYKPDGTYWTVGNNIVHLTLAESGTYTAKVNFYHATASGNYTLRYVRGGDAVENGVLTSGETASGALNTYDMDSYTFGGAAGETVTLIFDEATATTGTLYIYKPDGSYWTSGNNITHLTLPETGSYTVVLRLYHLTYSGSYQLHYVLGGDAVENTELISGTTLVESLNTYDMDSYYLDGIAGETITLMLDENESTTGVIYLYRPDGSYWTSGNNLTHVTLPDTGRYTVIIRFYHLTYSGDYSLHYVRGGAAVENGSLVSGETRTSSLSAYDIDSYTFSGNAGETVTLIMDEDESTTGSIYLYKPNGSYWTSGNNITHVTLPTSGEYTVVIRFYHPTYSGDYSLHYVRGASAVENGNLTSGTTQTNSLNTYDMDSYTFNGLAGESVTLIMDEAQSTTGAIYLYKPDGSYWTSGNNITHVTLPETGEYTVIVRYYHLTYSGEYSLHYVRGGDAVENGSLSNGSTQFDSLGAYDMDSYTFSALAGQSVNLTMTESLSTTGAIYIYRPDGSYWTSGYNSINATIPTTGTYTVVVRYYHLTYSGPYSLSYSAYFPVP